MEYLRIDLGINQYWDERNIKLHWINGLKVLECGDTNRKSQFSQIEL